MALSGISDSSKLTKICGKGENISLGNSPMKIDSFRRRLRKKGPSQVFWRKKILKIEMSPLQQHFGLSKFQWRHRIDSFLTQYFRRKNVSVATWVQDIMLVSAKQDMTLNIALRPYQKVLKFFRLTRSQRKGLMIYFDIE